VVVGLRTGKPQSVGDGFHFLNRNAEARSSQRKTQRVIGEN
jgi:hypothetical protein